MIADKQNVSFFFQSDECILQRCMLTVLQILKWQNAIVGIGIATITVKTQITYDWVVRLRSNQSTPQVVKGPNLMMVMILIHFKSKRHFHIWKYMTDWVNGTIMFKNPNHSYTEQKKKRFMIIKVLQSGVSKNKNHLWSDHQHQGV